MTINAIAAQVNAVLSVDSPMIKNTIPRMRNAPEVFRLFCFIMFPFIVPKAYHAGLDFVPTTFRTVFYFGLTSVYRLWLPNKSVDMPFSVMSKKDNR